MRLTERRRYASRGGHSTRLVLRALANAAQLEGSRYIAWGCRSLALGSGLDHTTVARVLRELRNEPDPLIDLVESQRGQDRADIYALRIPDEFADAARRTPWRPGRLEPIHPVFAELGVPAAFVFEALGERAEPLMTVDVADVALLGRTAATQALQTLAEMGLAERGRHGWVRGPIEPDAIADQLGARERFEARAEHYRAERKAYREYLGRSLVARADAAGPAGPPVDLWSYEADEPVIDLEPSTYLDLLERELGATLVYAGEEAPPGWWDTVPEADP